MSKRKTKVRDVDMPTWESLRQEEETARREWEGEFKVLKARRDVIVVEGGDTTEVDQKMVELDFILRSAAALDG